MAAHGSLSHYIEVVSKRRWRESWVGYSPWSTCLVPEAITPGEIVEPQMMVLCTYLIAGYSGPMQVETHPLFQDAVK